MSAEVSDIRLYQNRNASGGDSGGPSDMEQRVANLEQVTADMRETLARLDERTDSIGKHGATKADISDVRSDIKSTESTLVKWFVLTAITLVVAVATISFGAASLL